MERPAACPRDSVLTVNSELRDLISLATTLFVDMDERTRQEGWEVRSRVSLTAPQSLLAGGGAEACCATLCVSLHHTTRPPLSLHTKHGAPTGSHAWSCCWAIELRGGAWMGRECDHACQLYPQPVCMHLGLGPGRWGTAVCLALCV